MSFIQAVRLLDLQEVMESNAPGDPRLWEVLNDSLAGIQVQHMQILCLEWNSKPDRVPGLENWTEWLSLEGSLGVSLSTESENYCLQRRRKGFCNHPLEQLVSDWLQMQGFEEPERLWFADNYIVTGQGDAKRVFESLRGLMTLGSKSGIWDENAEECRLVSPKDSLSWPYHFEEELEKIELKADDFLKFLGPRADILSCRYALTENTGRGTPAATVVESPVELWRSFKQPALPQSPNTPLPPSAASVFSMAGPEHFVVALPKSAIFEKIGQDLKEFVESQAVLADRFPTIIRYRESASTTLHLESFPDLTTQLQDLSVISSTSKKRTLYAVTPWDNRNQIMVRRAENFLANAEKEGFLGTVLLPGALDWVSVILRLILNTGGWQMSDGPSMHLLRWNASRLASSNLLLFWAEVEKDIVDKTLFNYGLFGVSLGSSTNSNSFVVGEQTVPLVSVRLEEMREMVSRPSMVHARWVFKDQKSPTYGFEKAALFPDRFLKRMTQVGVKGEIQKEISWNISSTPVHRDHLMKHKSNQPITYVRWSDGERMWADSVASISGLSEYDPKALGEWTCDLALRGLVCKGYDFREQVYAQAWLSNPDATDQPEEQDRYGAFYLANLGLKAALEQLGIYFGGASFSGSYSRSRPYQQELIVRLRAGLPQNSRSVFPGFRMAGEVLYVLGPKPAFMDAGTRLLPHFRVVSNHISRLNLGMQREIYGTIAECVSSGLVTVARPIGQSGTLGAILEMSLWGNIGVTLKPSLTTIELFSGAPGRLVVGVLPQEAKRFESLFRQELISHIGESGGDRIFGQPLTYYRDVEGSVYAV